MEVLIFQIGIIAIICISALFGKNARRIIIIGLVIFTLIQVFMTWLVLLQLITIFIGYSISSSLLKNDKKKMKTAKESSHTHILKTYENGARVYKEYDLDSNLDPEIRRKIELDKEIKQDSLDKYNNDPEHKKLVDDVINKMLNKK